MGKCNNSCSPNDIRLINVENSLINIYRRLDLLQNGGHSTEADPVWNAQKNSYLLSSVAAGLFYPLSSNPAGYLTTAAANVLYQPLGNYVSSSRTITINGTSYDLSANRSWVISSTNSDINFTNEGFQI